MTSARTEEDALLFDREGGEVSKQTRLQLLGISRQRHDQKVSHGVVAGKARLVGPTYLGRLERDPSSGHLAQRGEHVVSRSERSQSLT